LNSTLMADSHHHYYTTTTTSLACNH
jgi:hypothetical protein